MFTNATNSGSGNSPLGVIPKRQTSLLVVWALFLSLFSISLATAPSANAVTGFTVTYNSDSATAGNVPVDTKTAGYSFDETSTIKVGTLSREGHTLIGWAFDRNPASPYFIAGYTYTIRGNVNLYPVWQANQYTVTFVNGGGSGPSVVETFTYGASLTSTRLGDKGFTRSNYSFSGYSPGDTTMPGSNLTLTAQWTGDSNNSCSIDLNAYYRANGPWSAGSDNVYGDSATVDAPANYNTCAGSNPSFGTSILTPTAPSRRGYTFNGWEKSPGGSIYNESTTAGTMPASPISFKALWVPNVTTFNFHSGANTAGNALPEFFTGSNGLLHFGTQNGDWFDFDPCGTLYVRAFDDDECNGVYESSTVTFDNEFWDTNNSYSFPYGRNGELLSNAYRDGYQIIGWSRNMNSLVPDSDFVGTLGDYDEGDGYDTYFGNYTLAESGTVDLYPVWEQLDISSVNLFQVNSNVVPSQFQEIFEGFFPDWLTVKTTGVELGNVRVVVDGIEREVCYWLDLEGSCEDSDFPVIFLDRNTLLVPAPVTTFTRTISITNNSNGDSTDFAYTLPITISSVTPGPITLTGAQNQEVRFQVNGGGFLAPGAPEFLFCSPEDTSTSCVIIKIDGAVAEEIEGATGTFGEISFDYNVAELKPGTHTISLARFPDFAEASITFQIIGAPAFATPIVTFNVTSISPARGALAGGETITVRGSGFVPGTLVKVGGIPATNVQINGEQTEITAVTPEGVALGNVNVIVEIPNGTSIVTPMTYSAPEADEINLNWGGDDYYEELQLPFPVKFNGVEYSKIYLGSNSYVTFGEGSTEWQDIAGINLPRILIDAADNYSNRAHFSRHTEPEGYWHLRYEGYRYCLDTEEPEACDEPASDGYTPTIIWELSAYDNDPDTLELRIVATDTQIDQSGSAPITGVFVGNRRVDSLGGPGTAWKITSSDVVFHSPISYEYAAPVVPVTPVINNPTTFVTNTVSVPAPALSAPKINGLSSASGSTAGGYALTLSGADFSATARVTIGGVAATITSQSATSITFTVPARAAGPVNVIVTNTDGGLATAAFNYEAPVVVVVAPTISAISPGSGNVKGGELVTISGTGFTAGAVVRIGASLASSVTVVNSSTITAVVPAGSVGTANVSVTNTDGGRAIGFYLYIADAKVTTEPTDNSQPAALVTTKNVTIGFKVGQSNLTAAQRNAIIAAGLKGNVVVTVYGYASATSNRSADRALALSRANSVKAQILRLVPTAVVTAIGKGSTYAAACVKSANRCAVVKVNQN